MRKKIIIYHLFLFLIVSLFSCVRATHIAPNPKEKENKFVEHLLRNIVTQGIDF